MKTNYLKKYIISSYILVWMLIIFVAGTASLVFHAPPVIMWIVRNLIAWSPTYLLLIGWKHFRPDETRTAFVKRCFRGKLPHGYHTVSRTNIKRKYRSFEVHKDKIV